jgi:hypothetical protein
VALYLRPHVKHAPQMNAQHGAANTFFDYISSVLDIRDATSAATAMFVPVAEISRFQLLLIGFIGDR